MEQESVTLIIDIINQTGFPIAAACGLFWIVNKTLKAQHEILKELKITIQNNTSAIGEISSKIGKTYDL